MFNQGKGGGRWSTRGREGGAGVQPGKRGVAGGQPGGVEGAGGLSTMGRGGGRWFVNHGEGGEGGAREMIQRGMLGLGAMSDERSSDTRGCTPTRL